MCVNIPPGDLNSDPYLLHFTDTFTYRVTMHQEYAIII